MGQEAVTRNCLPKVLVSPAVPEQRPSLPGEAVQAPPGDVPGRAEAAPPVPRDQQQQRMIAGSAPLCALILAHRSGRCRAWRGTRSNKRAPGREREKPKKQARPGRSEQGSNLRGETPLDFKSNALTTRPSLLMLVFLPGCSLIGRSAHRRPRRKATQPMSAGGAGPTPQ